MHLAIIDHSFADLYGHHYEYNGALVAAARARGLDVTVVANRNFAGDAGDMPVLPWFQQSFYALTRGNRLKRLVYPVLSRLPASFVAQGQMLARKTWTALRRVIPADNGFGGDLILACARLGLTAADHAIIHTLSMDDLESLATALLAKPEIALPTIHVLLGRRAAEMNIGRPPGRCAEDALRRLAADPIVRRRIRLYSDTQKIAAGYAALSPLGVGVLPVVFRLAPLLAAQARRSDQQSNAPIVLGYVGNARLEKGFQHLPALVRALDAHRVWAGRVRFMIQSPFNVPRGEPGVALAREKLAAHGSDLVELEERVLDTDSYYDFLTRADVLLLPYEARRYGIRSSGILVQARMAGIPLVVPARTWMAEQAPAPAGEAFDGPGDLAAATIRLLDRLPIARKSAADDALIWRERNGPERFVSILLGEVPDLGEDSLRDRGSDHNPDLGERH